MAQYGGNQVHRRQVVETDEHGNPVRITEEKFVDHPSTGLQFEREVRHVTDTGRGTMGDYLSTGQHQGFGHEATTGTGTGTGSAYGTTGHKGLGTNIGHGTVGTGVPDYSTGGDRTAGETGYQGLGTERGPTTGGGHQGLGEVNRGTGTGTTGQQGLGNQNIDHATWGTGTDNYPTGVRASVGQTGYQGLGTKRPGSGGTTGSYENRHDPTPMGGAGIGTGSGAVYGGTRDDVHEKKGVMEKIKEKLPGHH